MDSSQTVILFCLLWGPESTHQLLQSKVRSKTFFLTILAIDSLAWSGSITAEVNWRTFSNVAVLVEFAVGQREEFLSTRIHVVVHETAGPVSLASQLFIEYPCHPTHPSVGDIEVSLDVEDEKMFFIGSMLYNCDLTNEKAFIANVNASNIVLGDIVIPKVSADLIVSRRWLPGPGKRTDSQLSGNRDGNTHEEFGYLFVANGYADFDGTNVTIQANITREPNQNVKWNALVEVDTEWNWGPVQFFGSMSIPLPCTVLSQTAEGNLIITLPSQMNATFEAVAEHRCATNSWKFTAKASAPYVIDVNLPEVYNLTAEILGEPMEGEMVWQVSLFGDVYWEVIGMHVEVQTTFKYNKPLGFNNFASKIIAHEDQQWVTNGLEFGLRGDFYTTVPCVDRLDVNLDFYAIYGTQLSVVGDNIVILHPCNVTETNPETWFVNGHLAVDLDLFQGTPYHIDSSSNIFVSAIGSQDFTRNDTLIWTGKANFTENIEFPKGITSSADVSLTFTTDPIAPHPVSVDAYVSAHGGDGIVSFDTDFELYLPCDGAHSIQSGKMTLNLDVSVATPPTLGAMVEVLYHCNTSDPIEWEVQSKVLGNNIEMYGLTLETVLLETTRYRLPEAHWAGHFESALNFAGFDVDSTINFNTSSSSHPFDLVINATGSHFWPSIQLDLDLHFVYPYPPGMSWNLVGTADLGFAIPVIDKTLAVTVSVENNQIGDWRLNGTIEQFQPLQFLDPIEAGFSLTGEHDDSGKMGWNTTIHFNTFWKAVGLNPHVQHAISLFKSKGTQNPDDFTPNDPDDRRRIPDFGLSSILGDLKLKRKFGDPSTCEIDVDLSTTTDLPCKIIPIQGDIIISFAGASPLNITTDVTFYCETQPANMIGSSTKYMKVWDIDISLSKDWAIFSDLTLETDLHINATGLREKGVNDTSLDWIGDVHGKGALPYFGEIDAYIGFNTISNKSATLYVSWNSYVDLGDIGHAQANLEFYYPCSNNTMLKGEGEVSLDLHGQSAVVTVDIQKSCGKQLVTFDGKIDGTMTFFGITLQDVNIGLILEGEGYKIWNGSLSGSLSVCLGACFISFNKLGTIYIVY